MNPPRVQVWMEGWIHRRIGVHFDRNIEFSPQQAYEAESILNSFIGLKDEDKLKLRIKASLQQWLDVQVQSRRLFYDYFDRKWITTDLTDQERCDRLSE